MTITGFIGIYSDGLPAKIDAHGNNVAFACPSCGHPVLAIAREHQRGYAANNPAVCAGCGERLVIEVRESTKKVVIHRASEFTLEDL
jgi:predicted RNA-binding Zn-ribbon protein involved in translation (DUF1610 family)